MTNHLWLPRAAAVPSPGEVAAYLLQEAWTFQRADASWAVYAKTVGGEPVELEVPQQAAARDYARAVSVLLSDLARLEQRDPSAVLRDVRASSLDIVRLAVEGSSTRDGRISVEAGRRVYEAARDLLLAAACSVLDARPVFPRRKPDEAMSLLGRARFGETELGSFVLTMECAVPPRLQASLLDDDADADAPFERKTCLRLADALLATEVAARESAASGRVEPFRERSQRGVSANLCEAVAEILDATAGEALRAGFSFASRRPVRRDAPRSVTFSADTVPTLREAAARLRDEARYPATEVQGPVWQLKRPTTSGSGEAVLRADVDGRMGSVKLRLEEADYARAIDAHRDGSLLRCTGDLQREGRSWVLLYPRDLRTVLEGDEAP